MELQRISPQTGASPSAGDESVVDLIEELCGILSADRSLRISIVRHWFETIICVTSNAVEQYRGIVTEMFSTVSLKALELDITAQNSRIYEQTGVVSADIRLFGRCRHNKHMSFPISLFQKEQHPLWMCLVYFFDMSLQGAIGNSVQFYKFRYDGVWSRCFPRVVFMQTMFGYLIHAGIVSMNIDAAVDLCRYSIDICRLRSCDMILSLRNVRSLQRGPVIETPKRESPSEEEERLSGMLKIQTDINRMLRGVAEGAPEPLMEFIVSYLIAVFERDNLAPPR